jgi:two-component system response regulator AtoC
MTAARLAIVDDDPDFGQYLATLLASRGYEVNTFERGNDLLRALERGATPDVVLLDVLMPGMDGLETLRAARALQPELQVIMLSGTQVPATIVDAVRLGAIDYVIKPTDADGLGEAALESTIRSAIEKVSLTREVARLRAQVGDETEGGQACWSADPAMKPVLTTIDRVADSDVSVLISGESGVGKEVIARELHRRSSRRGQGFVKVSCAALPSELLESELFGHERGAFTGAQASRIGKFEFAHMGTIMLDEIGEMPLLLQAKLLHVLQDREFTRLGSNRAISVDVRVIAATNRDLSQMMRTGQFREDLYYRLQVIEIRVPPLRERRGEILPLVEFFLSQYAARYGRRVVRPSPTLREALVQYAWPGNVRELENVIKRFVILDDEALLLEEISRPIPPAATLPGVSGPGQGQPGSEGDGSPWREGSSNGPVAGAADPPGASTAAATPAAGAALSDNGRPAAPPTLLEVARRAAQAAEREAIERALDRFRWNRKRAAEHLGVSYKTLLNKMKECGINPLKEEG